MCCSLIMPMTLKRPTFPGRLPSAISRIQQQIWFHKHLLNNCMYSLPMPQIQNSNSTSIPANRGGSPEDSGRWKLSICWADPWVGSDWDLCHCGPSDWQTGQLLCLLPHGRWVPGISLGHYWSLWQPRHPQGPFGQHHSSPEHESTCRNFWNWLLSCQSRLSTCP